MQQRRMFMSSLHFLVQLSTSKLSDVFVKHRYGDYACTAYVTFKERHALETAVLLSGATIVDEPVCIARWGHYEDDTDFWERPSWRVEDDANSSVCSFGLLMIREEIDSLNQKQGSNGHFISSPGEAVTMVQEVVKTMLSKGYVLAKDALIKATEFDESHQVSASAAAKVAELSKRVGLTDKINAGVDAVKSVDERYHVSEDAKTAFSATSRTAGAAARAVVNSSYFSAGALWVSDALNRAAKAAADLGTHGVKK